MQTEPDELGFRGMNLSNLGRLGSRDFILGLVVAVGAAVFAALGQAFNAPGFDFLHFNWYNIVSVGATAGLGYLSKNLLTDRNGEFLGKV